MFVKQHNRKRIFHNNLTFCRRLISANKKGAKKKHEIRVTFLVLTGFKTSQ